MLGLRRFFFYLFGLIYLIVCPLTLLYASGYALRPAPQPQWVETGLIDLNTQPPGAFIFLNGRRAEQRTPAVFRELIPGTYRIALHLKGHRSWERTVTVGPKQAHVLDKLLLLPHRPKDEWLSNSSWSHLIPIEQTPWVILLKSQTLQGAAVFDQRSDKLRPLLPEFSPWAEAKFLDFRAVPESPWVFLKLKSKRAQGWVGISLNENPAKVEDLMQLLPAEPELLTWWPTLPERLYALEQGQLQMIDLKKATATLVRDGVRGIGLLSSEELILLDDQGVLERLRFDGERLESSHPEEKLFGDKEIFSIEPIDSQNWLFLGSRGEFLINRLPYRLAKEALGFKVDPRRQHLAVWTARQLGVAQIDPLQTGFFETGPKVRWIFESARRMEQAFWAYEASHLILNDAGRIFLMETQTHADPDLGWDVSGAVVPLMEVAKGSRIAYWDQTGELIFLERSRRRLARRFIVSRPEP